MATEEKGTAMNLVVYMAGRSLQRGKSHLHYLGGHGYSYTIANEGKKKLAKDVATTSGYYTGNNQKANTVVVVEDILNLVVPNSGSLFQAAVKGFAAVLDLYLQPGSEFKNLCVVTPHKELQDVFRFKEENIKVGVRIGRTELTKEDVEVFKEAFITIERFKALETSKVVFDFAGSAEGGTGNKQAYKLMEIAEVVSIWSNDKEVEISLTPRKIYENPETDFIKIITATRWYYENVKAEQYYDLKHGMRKYCFGKVEPDKNYYGKLTPDVTYSALFVKEPITLLDKLYEFSRRKIDNPDGYLLAGDLNHLTSKEVARMIDTHPAIREGNNLVSPVTKQNGKPVLIELIQPVLMSYRIRDDLNAMDFLLDAFKAKDKNNVFGYSKFYDITDQIYAKEENKKGVVKVKLNPDFNPLKSVVSVKIEHPKAVKPVTLNLNVGYDLPERNSFNSVEDPDVKVWVVADTRNDAGVRYCTLTETNDWIYIHTSAAANLKVLSLDEQGRSK